jgi:DNA-directed RNA polymerase subunit omega
LNAEFCRLALEKVVNPNILVNLISRRVRQLSSGGGGSSRPLITVTPGMGWADIALQEIAFGKLGWDMIDEAPPSDPVAKRRGRKS